MDTRMTVIVDNVSADGIEGEWGLSILIQLGGKQILLDAGRLSCLLRILRSLVLILGMWITVCLAMHIMTMPMVCQSFLRRIRRRSFL